MRTEITPFKVPISNYAMFCSSRILQNVNCMVENKVSL